jgi:hypothetical protein
MFFCGLGNLGMCIIARRSILGILYVPAVSLSYVLQPAYSRETFLKYKVIFNALALAATIWNAIGRPCCQGTSLMQYLRQDGFIFVLVSYNLIQFLGDCSE